jgi:putative flippase GtrA
MKMPGLKIKNPELEQIVRYVLIGIVTTMISFGTFWALLQWTETSTHPANIISVLLAVIFAYLANKILVFRSSCKDILSLIFEILRFVLSRGISLLMEIGGVFFFHNMVSLSPLVSKLIVSFVILIYNYLAFRLIVFKRS